MEQVSARSSRWDDVVRELDVLRQRAGEPSYAELARAVTTRRVSRGLDEHASRVARTTVYDVFRPGRSRVNVDLVRDLAAVLGAPEGEVDRWLSKAHGVAEPVADVTPEPEPVVTTGPGRRLVWALLVGCVLVNVLGRFFVDGLHLPIYLDMVGTAFAAMALGPWAGAGVGVVSNLLGSFSSGTDSIPFALVNVAGALVWGYGVRRGGGRTLARFLGLNLLVALVCTLVAVPILVLAYAGTTGHGEDSLAANLQAMGQTLAVSVAGANLLVSVADKTISGFLALVALSTFPWARHRGLELLPPAPPR